MSRSLRHSNNATLLHYQTALKTVKLIWKRLDVAIVNRRGSAGTELISSQLRPLKTSSIDVDTALSDPDFPDDPPRVLSLMGFPLTPPETAPFLGFTDFYNLDDAAGDILQLLCLSILGSASLDIRMLLLPLARPKTASQAT